MRYMLLLYADQTKYMPTTQEEISAEVSPRASGKDR